MHGTYISGTRKLKSSLSGQGIPEPSIIAYRGTILIVSLQIAGGNATYGLFRC